MFRAAGSDRLVTAPLLVFAGIVLGVVTIGLVTRHPRPGLDGAIELLADGDLDGDERRRMLARTLELARQAPQAAQSARHHFAGLMAAAALQDHEAFAALSERWAERWAEPAPTAQQMAAALLPDEWLALGDPLLANLKAATCAELAGDGDAAQREWRRVAAVARMTGNDFVSGLAEAAAQRLR
jgi:hypothetical protein